MAAIAAIVIAIVRSGWRSLRAASSLTGNNLVGLIALLMAEEPTNRPSRTTVFYMMIGLLWVLPLSQELTRRIPPLRFRLWPLNPLQRAIIYVVNLLLNPLVFTAIFFGMLSRDRQVGLGLVAIGAVAPIVVLAGRILARPISGWSPLGLVPRPPGRLGGLVQNQIRELLHLLDVYFALMTAIAGFTYIHFGVNPGSVEPFVIGCLVVLLMSTCAQGHVTLDLKADQTRMRLLPISGAAVLFSRDAAWMLVTIPLTVGFPILPSASSALAVLVIGHRTSIKESIEQRRWNFATGRLFPHGVFQMLVLVGAGSAVQHWGWPTFAVLTGVYLGSLWWSGLQMGPAL